MLQMSDKAAFISMGGHRALTWFSQFLLQRWKLCGKSPRRDLIERLRMHKNSMKSITRGAASTAICAALALGTAGIASAHGGQHPDKDATTSHHEFRSHHSESRPGNDEVGGIVTALGTNSITIQLHNDTPVVYTTTSATTYSLGMAPATVAALAVGENVDVTLSSATPATVTTVEVDLANVEGKVTAISGNTITLGSGSDTRTVTVTTSTTFVLAGVASTFGAIVVGSHIEARGIATSSSALSAMSVKIEPVRLDTHAAGVVTALGTNSITIQHHNDTPVVYTTTSTTTYAMGEITATVAALAVGQNVDITLTSTTPQTVTAIEVDLANVEGKVTAISGNTITLGSGSDTRTVTVGTATTYTLGDAVSALSAIVVGSHIEARGVATTSTALNATSVKINLGDHDDE
jgi:hypothetical protein